MIKSFENLKKEPGDQYPEFIRANILLFCDIKAFRKGHVIKKATIRITSRCQQVIHIPPISCDTCKIGISSNPTRKIHIIILLYKNKIYLLRLLIIRYYLHFFK